MFFFFQAEDGIRDIGVTGVQTCALPISRRLGDQLPGTIVTTAGGCAAHLAGVLGRDRVKEFSEYVAGDGSASFGELRVDGRRSEEGRGGEGCRSRWSAHT